MINSVAVTESASASETALATRYLETVAVITDARIKAITFDMEVLGDHLRYSAWSAAIATAGIALILTKRADFHSSFFRDTILRLGVTASAIVLAVAVIIAGAINWKINTALEARRQIMTFALKQRLLLFCRGTAPEIVKQAIGDVTPFARTLMNLEHLSAKDKTEYSKWEKRAGDTEDFKNPTLLQHATVAAGYLLLMIVAI